MWWILAWILAVAGLLIYLTDPISLFATTKPESSSETRVAVLFDAWVNRQPYYASFHAFFGCLVVWGYLAFNVAYVVALGGRGATVLLLWLSSSIACMRLTLDAPRERARVDTEATSAEAFTGDTFSKRRRASRRRLSKAV